jgi:general secretion pathway protein G
MGGFMKKAFTLIELMLVIIIIGVLASVAVPRLVGRAERARKIAAKADIEANIPSALDLYEMDMGEYPKALQDLMSDPSGTEAWAGPYLKKFPRDPWGRDYYYKCPGDHSSDYDLASPGKDGVLGSGEDDVTNWE